MNEGDFAIAWPAAARRALTRLPEKVATAVAEFIYGSLAANPHRVGKPLKLTLEGLHSARRGDYRVIYRIDDEQRLVTVIAIEHRSDAYRPRLLRMARRSDGQRRQSMVPWASAALTRGRRFSGSSSSPKWAVRVCPPSVTVSS